MPSCNLQKGMPSSIERFPFHRLGIGKTRGNSLGTLNKIQTFIPPPSPPLLPGYKRAIIKHLEKGIDDFLYCSNKLEK